MRAWSRGEASPGETAGLDEQGLDRGLLLRLYDRLADRTVIDVGAERGAFVEAFLDAGCARVYAVEPYPANIRVYPQLAPLLRQAAEEAQTRLLDTARELRRHAQRRLEIIAELRSEAERRQLTNRLGRWLRPRLGYLRHLPGRSRSRAGTGPSRRWPGLR